MEGTKLAPLTEFETKYKVDSDMQFPFKDLMEKQEGLKEFLYVEGPDLYWTKGEDSFQRYRKAAHDKSGKAWLTNKFKITEGNNIQRKEHNIRVDHTPLKEIKSYVESLGYSFNFEINKNCHIYKFNDATVVYYSVRDSDGNRNYFIEIEVDESSIHNLSEDQAWEVIKKYEKKLETLGIKPQNRLRKSLFEMYKKEL